jgi:2-octaprenyl-6-methoxyphenol hydroxylase
MNATDQFDILIAGAGAAGLTMAVAAADAGWRVGLIDPGPLTPKPIAKRNPDARTTAVMASGIRMLNRLQIWPILEPISAPLRYLELIDDSTGKQLRQRFDAREIGQEWFAQNIPNEALKSALLARLLRFETVTLLPQDKAQSISNRDNHLVIDSDHGRLQTRLLVAADGHRSPCRTMLRLGISASDQRETALVFNTGHTLDHQGISYEFHGPIDLDRTGTAQVTTIPLPGMRSAINLVGDTRTMDAFMALDASDRQTVVQAATRGVLGEITAAEHPKAYPIRPFRARGLSSDRAVLIGEAAHALPPIGAQGLNTTLADIAVLIDLLGDATTEDPGRKSVTDGYNRNRRTDIIARSNATGILSNMVHRGNPVVDRLRRLGLQAIGSMGPLRRQLMTRGMAPLGKTPSLMAE